MQSKAQNFHAFSVLSSCDNLLQARDVWYQDGTSRPSTLLKSTELQRVQKPPSKQQQQQH